MLIHYLFLEEEAPENFHSIFHLLREAEMALLRCFMALLCLPADADRIVSDQVHPFTDALTRVHHLPSFRRASAGRPPTELWEDMLKFPLLVLMVGDALPEWIKPLAAARPIVLLSHSEAAIEASLALPRVFPGLLRGMEDIRVFYGALRALCGERATDERLDEDVRRKLHTLANIDLFARRSRLDFIPGLPLPQPSQGRPATYLLNRLSNNLDEPALHPNAAAGSERMLPQLLKWSIRACGALALLEMGRVLPGSLGGNKREIEETRTVLLSHEDGSTKFRAMIELGQRIQNERWLANVFLTIPAARVDLLRGRVPDGANPDPRQKIMVKPGLRAVADFIRGTDKATFRTEAESKGYDRARETLLLEQRFLACQTACLASRSGAIPVQVGVLSSDIYNVVRDLHKAIDANSRKVTRLFQRVERALARLLPPWILDDLAKGDSLVQVFSDLPIEWTIVDEWPLCLTRPVSRIPIGVTRWEVLGAVLEQPASIDVRTPERVLVFDLIPQHDPIRHHSDAFISVSNSLAQRYVYASPTDAAEFRRTLEHSSPEIVVLDTHGRYDRAKDQVWISLPAGAASVDELVPDIRVPPVWILSACDMSVTGAMRGCFVRRLLARGAVCVIATLAQVDAFTASMFVGRLLTDIYNPVKPGAYESFDQVFFAAQFTTALLYDPLLPLIRKAARDRVLGHSLGGVFGEYFAWATLKPIDNVRRFRHEAAWALGECLARHGLTTTYSDEQRAGNVRPETLLFSAFGVPSHIALTS